jgi:membrane-associated protease RseP (regulator of RpoE activity)
MTFWFGVIVFALGILLSVCLHEAGHLITAKKFGMKATQFFAGFGPTLWSFRRGETEYGLKAFPAGGFVKIVGMTPLEENIAPEDMHRAFWRKPVWQRTIVLAAGSATHFVLALLIFYLAAVTTGLPNAAAEEFEPLDAPPVIGQVTTCVVPDYTIVTKDGQETLRDCRPGDPIGPAKAAGLRAGDRFESVGDTPVSTYGDFVRAIRAREPGSVQVTYVRGTQERTATVDLVATQRPALDAEDDTKLETVSAIGIAVAVPRLINDYGPLSGIGGAASYTGHMVQRTFQAIAKFPSKIPKLIDAIQGEERDQETPISVVGASRIGGEAAELDLPIVFLAALGGLNVFIGVFNLFPLLPLDGGHIAIIWFERARSWLAARRGRPDPGRVDYNKLMPVTLVVIVLFGGLTVLTLAADIINPITLRQ